MNIFYLDHDPLICAQYHTDSHVVKMILESCQMLCTVHHLNDVGRINPIFYKPTHPNHPCVKWLQESTENYFWLWSLASALAYEKRYRFPKPDHKSVSSGLLDALKSPAMLTPNKELTPPAQAMPPEMRSQCAVTAYRRYYRQCKQHLHQWTRRPVPHFITEEIENHGKPEDSK
jgi:hypothetical protein